MTDHAQRAARDAVVEGLDTLAELVAEARGAVEQDNLPSLDVALGSIATEVLATARATEHLRIEVSTTVQEAERLLGELGRDDRPDAC